LVTGTHPQFKSFDDNSANVAFFSRFSDLEDIAAMLDNTAEAAVPACTGSRSPSRYLCCGASKTAIDESTKVDAFAHLAESHLNWTVCDGGEYGVNRCQVSRNTAQKKKRLATPIPMIKARKELPRYLNTRHLSRGAAARLSMLIGCQGILLSIMRTFLLKAKLFLRSEITDL
jgi:hypothetical protein